MSNQKKFKTGDQVMMYNCGEADQYPTRVWTCRGDQFETPSQMDVVFLEGFSGYFHARCLRFATETEIASYQLECDAAQADLQQTVDHEPDLSRYLLFEWADLHEKTLEMTVSEVNGYRFISGCDKETNKLYLLHYEKLNAADLSIVSKL